MYCAAGNMRIQDFVDRLLSLDSIQTLKHVTDGGNEILTISTLYPNIAFRKLSLEKLFDFFQLQNKPALLPVIENGINIIIVFRHQGSKLGVVLTTQVNSRETDIFQLPLVVFIEKHLVLQAQS